jgi:hypothetical protein
MSHDPLDKHKSIDRRWVHSSSHPWELLTLREDHRLGLTGTRIVPIVKASSFVDKEDSFCSYRWPRAGRRVAAQIRVFGAFAAPHRRTPYRWRVVERALASYRLCPAVARCLGGTGMRMIQHPIVYAAQPRRGGRGIQRGAFRTYPA